MIAWMLAIRRKLKPRSGQAAAEYAILAALGALLALAASAKATIESALAGVASGLHDLLKSIGL
jgi:Flp pilus assembly pilin Flp